MFRIGETVSYGAEGLCSITAIEEMKLGGTKGKYYVLKPIYRPNATVYVPAENELLVGRMHPVLSAQEIHELLIKAAREESFWIEDANERRTQYSKLLLTGDRYGVARMILALFGKRQQLSAAGKRLRNGDDQFLREGEKLLYEEFAYVLDIPRKDVAEYVQRIFAENV